MSSRRKWEFELFTHAAPDVCAAVTRAIAREDVPAIASIMYRAFQGTVDDDGMPEEQAARKVNAIIDGKYGPFIAAASRVTIVDGGCVAFLLATDYEPYGMPVIAAIAVAPEYRRRRYGRLLLQAATQAACDPGLLPLLRHDQPRQCRLRSLVRIDRVQRGAAVVKRRRHRFIGGLRTCATRRTQSR